LQKYLRSGGFTMGYMRAHSIAVESWDVEKLSELHMKACLIFDDLVTEIIKERCNGYMAFFIAPDGSKEGWADSDNGDIQRKEFINEIREYNNGDGSNPIRYCEFYWSDDEEKAAVIRHN
jgi:hypothetical protein